MRTPNSSFVESVSYKPIPGIGGGFLDVVIRGTHYVYIAPFWVIGLFAAARKRGRSAGRLYNRVVKGLPNVRV